MQTAIANLSAPIASAIANSVKVFHATRNIELHFDSAVGAEWGVAYAYCEENKRLSELFSHREAGTLPEMYAKLPMTRGKFSVACDDWMACFNTTVINPAGVATPQDIKQILVDVGVLAH